MSNSLMSMIGLEGSKRESGTASGVRKNDTPTGKQGWRAGKGDASGEAAKDKGGLDGLLNFKPFDGVIDQAGDVIDGAVDTAGDAVDGAVDTAGKLVDGAVDTAGDIVDGAADVVNDAVNGVVDTAKNAIDFAGDVVGDVADGVGNVVSDVVDWVGSAKDWVMDKIDDFVDVVFFGQDSKEGKKAEQEKNREARKEEEKKAEQAEQEELERKQEEKKQEKIKTEHRKEAQKAPVFMKIDGVTYQKQAKGDLSETGNENVRYEAINKPKDANAKIGVDYRNGFTRIKTPDAEVQDISSGERGGDAKRKETSPFASKPQDAVRGNENGAALLGATGKE